MNPRSPRLIVLSLLAFATALLATEVPTAKRALTLERLAAEPPIVERGAAALRWRDGLRFTWVASEGPGRKGSSVLWEEDAATGEKRKLVAEDAIKVAPGSGKGEKEEKSPVFSLAKAVWNRGDDAFLLSAGNDLWLYELDRKGARRLTRDEADEEVPTFSPDGRWVAFVRKNDIYALEVASGHEVRLTSTGGEHVLNGKLDWVYEEELAGRRSSRSYEWSPDSRAIAYLQLDEGRVPEHPILDHIPVQPKLTMQRYPKPGDPNAIPSVHIVELPGPDGMAAARSVQFEPDDLLIGPEISWTADGKAACFVELNREQTRLRVRLLSRDGTSSRTLLTESDPAWINAIEPPLFLKDGSGFLFLSERSGFLHLYVHGMDGKLRNAVTSGRWMIDRSWEVDEKDGTVTFLGTEKDPRERHVYRVKLDGKGFTRVSRERGVHSFVVSPGGAYVLDTFSNIETPSRTALLGRDGSLVRMVDEPKNALSSFSLGRTELGSFTTSDGTLLYYRLLKPAGFDPSRTYPVIVSVYGGPHVQMVEDRWGSSSLFDHLCAERGFLVFSVDNRGSWGRGHAFETPILGKLGEVELKDQLEGVAFLAKLPFVDSSRVGIWGWSYGGFMAVRGALFAPKSFACAVAGAPVTDWRLYDSVYTERYMKLPRENGASYDATSLVKAAGKLDTRLLVLHGTLDDNVHLQQTITFADAAMRGGKSFDFVPLPGQAHGPREPAARATVNRRVLDFFEGCLKPEARR